MTHFIDNPNITHCFPPEVEALSPEPGGFGEVHYSLLFLKRPVQPRLLGCDCRLRGWCSISRRVRLYCLRWWWFFWRRSRNHALLVLHEFVLDSLNDVVVNLVLHAPGVDGIDPRAVYRSPHGRQGTHVDATSHEPGILLVCIPGLVEFRQGREGSGKCGGGHL